MLFWVKHYLGFQKQSVEGALQVLAKPLKTVFNEAHFIVNLLYQNSIKKDDVNISLVIYILVDLQYFQM